MGTPGTYGLPPTEPNVTSCWPACSTAVALNSCSCSESGPDRLLPMPVTEPTSPLPAIRTPTVEDRSVASSTVAVVELTLTTRPTSPSPFSTVSSGLIPSALPASIVTVSS